MKFANRFVDVFFLFGACANQFSAGEEKNHRLRLIHSRALGDRMKIPADIKFHPEAGHFGKVVWISEDGKTVAIQCEKRHNRKIAVFMVRIDSKE